MPTYQSAVAHTPTKYSSPLPHLLPDHSQGALVKALRLTDHFRLKSQADALLSTGISIHDIGKMTDEFAAYLVNSQRAMQLGLPKLRSVDHKKFGAWGAYYLMPEDMRVALCCMILGHHDEIPAVKDLATEIAKVNEKAPRIRAAFAELKIDLPVFDAGPLNDDRLGLEMFIRMLTSCLVDADCLDTESYCHPGLYHARQKARSCVADYGNDWLAKIADAVKEKQDGMEEGVVKDTRNLVYESCLAQLAGAPGFYSLVVPTGGAKTLSCLAGCIKHALVNKKDRVLVVTPFIAILEQTAKVFREILGDPGILEHYSGADETSVDEPWRCRLLTRNHDAALVLMTDVQLFGSLLSNKAGRIRKIHNFTGTVIMIDEVQCLPVHLLQPLVDVLKLLVRDYGCTVVLCTATMPALEGKKPYLDGIPQMTPIIADSKTMFAKMKRVSYVFLREKWSWARLALEIDKREESVMVIVNTKKDALSLIKQLGHARAYHISTNMCPAHRTVRLEEIRRKLKASKEGGPRVILVTTQAIEAGVDIDFPYGFRAFGPLPNIFQAGGRYNREGLLRESIVTVFQPLETSMNEQMGAYYKETQDTIRFLNQHKWQIDMDDPETVQSYYREVYFSAGPNDPTDSNGVQALREDFNYPRVAANSKLIDDDTVSLLVPYDVDLFNSIRAAALSKDDILKWNDVSRNSVPLRRDNIASLGARVQELIPDSLYAWTGTYDDTLGIGVIQD